MKEYVLDANTLIRFLKVGKGGGGERVEVLFEDAQKGHASLFISVVNFGEVFYVLLRYMDEPSANRRVETMERAVSIVAVDRQRALHAAALKHKYKLGYADSYAAALALERGATLVSADPEFERCGRTLKWLRLPPYAR